MQLNQELHNIFQCDAIINAYYTRIKNLADLLENIEANVPKNNLGSYTINGLNPQFDNVASILRYCTPFPTILETHYILPSEEKIMNHCKTYFFRVRILITHIILIHSL